MILFGQSEGEIWERKALWNHHRLTSDPLSNFDEEGEEEEKFCGSSLFPRSEEMVGREANAEHANYEYLEKD